VAPSDAIGLEAAVDARKLGPSGRRPPRRWQDENDSTAFPSGNASRGVPCGTPYSTARRRNTPDFGRSPYTTVTVRKGSFQNDTQNTLRTETRDRSLLSPIFKNRVTVPHPRRCTEYLFHMRKQCSPPQLNVNHRACAADIETNIRLFVKLTRNIYSMCRILFPCEPNHQRRRLDFHAKIALLE